MRFAVAPRAALGAALIALSMWLGTGSALAVATAKTDSAINVTTTTAVLKGTVTATDPDTAYRFVYGTTTSYTKTTPPVVAKVGNNDVTAPISGLAPYTTYHFELVAADAVSEPQQIILG